MTSYLRSVSTGYALLVANTAYSLAIVPLAISYLGTETFGLWALTIQIGAIAQLADAGMTGALTRLLMDHKDDKASPHYRELFYTMCLVFALIGALVAFLVVIASPWLVSLLAIPGHLATDYRQFLNAYIVALGIWFAFKPVPMLAFIHQRSDVLNIISLFGFILAFAIIWFTLSLDWGLWSLLAGFFASQILTNLVVVFQNIRMGFFPSRQSLPKFSLRAFREVISYSKDRFLIIFGLTFLQAAPTFLITRLLGLEANAVWTVASRSNQLCFVLVAKLSELSYPALAEMYVRGEKALLEKRHSQLMLTGLGLASFFAFGIATCNSAFVSLWTDHKISSSPLLDGAIAFWLICQTMQRFIFVPVSIARDLRGVRASYVYETILFLLAGYFLIRFTENLVAVPAVLCLASLCFTLPVFFRKAASVLDTGIASLLQPLQAISLKILLPLVFLAWINSFFPMPTTWPALLLKGVIISLIGAATLSSHRQIRQIAADIGKRLVPTRHRKKTA